jgi:hypothetical protein
MFEDFKEKLGKLQNKLNSEIPQISTTLAPDISEKLKKTGIDPQITLPCSSYFPQP